MSMKLRLITEREFRLVCTVRYKWQMFNMRPSHGETKDHKEDRSGNHHDCMNNVRQVMIGYMLVKLDELKEYLFANSNFNSGDQNHSNHFKSINQATNELNKGFFCMFLDWHHYKLVCKVTQWLSHKLIKFVFYVARPGLFTIHAMHQKIHAKHKRECNGKCSYQKCQPQHV